MTILKQVISSLCGMAWLTSTLHAQEGTPPANPGFIWPQETQITDEIFAADWYMSDFAIQRGWINTIWDTAAITLDATSITLNLSPTTDPDTSGGKDFAGAELQRQTTSGFGRYEVVMTPAKADGVISSFFTYTGAWFDNPHDEIDIEFLGRDTTRIWVMAFADGNGLPGTHLDLGFDAADAPHLYAFDWQPDKIIWYVDGVEIYRITADQAVLPSTPGKVYINLWTGGPGQKNWAGMAEEDTQTFAKYYCMSFQPRGELTPQCSDRFPFE